MNLSCSLFSNCVIQKFINDDKLHEVLIKFLFRNKVYVLSKKKHACRVVQKDIETMLHRFECENEAIYVFFKDIFGNKSSLKALISGRHKNHVVQKMISVESSLVY
ncbi:hypothetical protein CDIK_2823 [Cucumispora dikerogammari]|nr:hypothetical protein CDIK_2823 [Cucumispora dikerogammari]